MNAFILGGTHGIEIKIEDEYICLSNFDNDNYNKSHTFLIGLGFDPRRWFHWHFVGLGTDWWDINLGAIFIAIKWHGWNI